MVPHGIGNSVEEFRNFILGLVGHASHNLFHQMGLVATTGLYHDLTWGSTLHEQIQQTQQP
jgi:hypothetical protein